MKIHHRAIPHIPSLTLLEAIIPQSTLTNSGRDWNVNSSFQPRIDSNLNLRVWRLAGRGNGVHPSQFKCKYILDSTAISSPLFIPPLLCMTWFIHWSSDKQIQFKATGGMERNQAENISWHWLFHLSVSKYFSLLGLGVRKIESESNRRRGSLVTHLTIKLQHWIIWWLSTHHQSISQYATITQQNKQRTALTTWINTHYTILDLRVTFNN